MILLQPVNRSLYCRHRQSKVFHGEREGVLPEARFRARSARLLSKPISTRLFRSMIRGVKGEGGSCCDGIERVLLKIIERGTVQSSSLR